MSDTAAALCASRDCHRPPPYAPNPFRFLVAAAPPTADQLAQNLTHSGSTGPDAAAAGTAGGHALAHRNLLSGRQAAAGPGRLRRLQLDGLASPHDPVSAGPLFSGAAETAAQKEAPALAAVRTHLAHPGLSAEMQQGGYLVSHPSATPPRRPTTNISPQHWEVKPMRNYAIVLGTVTCPTSTKARRPSDCSSRGA